MKTTGLWMAPLAMAALGSHATAQRGAETLLLMPEGAESPGVVTNLIEVPSTAGGVAQSAQGLATANEARELGRAFGESMAAEARERRENSTRGARPEAGNSPASQTPDATLSEAPVRPAASTLPERHAPPGP